jgi:hypothetical protein
LGNEERVYRISRFGKSPKLLIWIQLEIEDAGIKLVVAWVIQ